MFHTNKVPCKVFTAEIFICFQFAFSSQQKKQHTTNEKIVNSKIEFLKLSCIKIKFRIETNTKDFALKKLNLSK